LHPGNPVLPSPLPCARLATHLQFRRMGYQVVDMMCDYFNKVEGFPVKPSVSVSRVGRGDQ